MEELQQYQDRKEARETERQVGSEITVRGHWPQCPRCNLVLDPFLDCAMTYDGVCPRCAYDLINTIDISTESLVDPEKLKEWVGLKEFHTLVKILDNWLSGYLGVIARMGVDWSAPHEFFQEFAELMFPYIRRLEQSGYGTPERMALIGDKVTAACQAIIEACQQEEDLMRLCGSWTDTEQEIKDYWKEKTGRIGHVAKAQGFVGISVQVES